MTRFTTALSQSVFASLALPRLLACLLTLSGAFAQADALNSFDTVISTQRGGAESGAAYISQAMQQVIPRRVEREPESVEHVDSGVRGSCFDALHVASVYLRTFSQIILRQSALHSQAVDVFPEYGARRQTHSPNVRHCAETGSGLIFAFSIVDQLCSFVKMMPQSPDLNSPLSNTNHDAP